MQVINHLAHLIQSKAIRIQRQRPPIIHVIDIRPHCLERDIRRTIIRDHACDLIDILVAVAALMESKSPVRHQSGISYRLCNLHRCLLRIRPGHEVEVEDAAEGSVLEVLTLVVHVDVDFHPVRAKEVHRMCSIGPAMVKVDIVRAVEIGSLGEERLTGVPERM